MYEYSKLIREALCVCVRACVRARLWIE